MSQIGELVEPAIYLEKHDEDCYFCNNKKEPEPMENDPTPHFNEDQLVGIATKGGIQHDNDAGKLGRKLSGAGEPSPKDVWAMDPNWRVDGSDDEFWAFPVEYAAHHLIPGNGSLNKSKLFKDDEIGIKTKGKKVGNVGYDVNNKTNGVWLPGCYAFLQTGKKKKGKPTSEWGTGGGTFKRTYSVEPAEYAEAAMFVPGQECQFHDAHTDYNKLVLGGLDQIYDKLGKTKKVWCPEAAKKKDDKRPLYFLVIRLASVSLKMRKMLEGSFGNWKTNVFTSKWALQWMQTHNKNAKRGKI